MRYFLFHYNWTSRSTGQFGDGNLWGEFSEFPSNAMLQTLAAKNIPTVPDAAIVVAGWNEFKTKSDYANFANSAGD